MLKEKFTFASAKADRGWWTKCNQSPIRRGKPRLTTFGKGWEQALEWKYAREGYIYACRQTSKRSGFVNKAEWQYWSLWRRPIQMVQ